LANPARNFMNDIATSARREASQPPARGAATGDDLERAKRALWIAEERFRDIIRKNAHVRGTSARIDDAVGQAFVGVAAIRNFFEGR